MRVFLNNFFFYVLLILLLIGCVRHKSRRQERVDSAANVGMNSINENSSNEATKKVAVLEFKAGVGVLQNYANSWSALFSTYFRPVGYTIVERIQLDKVIIEQGLQNSSLTEEQMVHVGRMLNVSHIVIGDVSRTGEDYNVDIRVVDVETGAVIISDGVTFSHSKYRSEMKNMAKNIATQMNVIGDSDANHGSVSQKEQVALKKRSSVETLYGYLHIFPNDLGIFQSEPNNLISNINQQQMYGYDNWRLPTNEELSILSANGYLSPTQYMTNESLYGMVVLVSTGSSVEEIHEAEKQMELEAKQRELERRKELFEQGYVDLGLPSGTLWKSKNEYNYAARSTFFSKESVKEFGNRVPTKQQFVELMEKCKRTNEYRGYYKDYKYLIFVGPNGNTIELPAQGMIDYLGTEGHVGDCCYYWVKEGGFDFDCPTYGAHYRSLRLVAQ